MSEEQAAAAEPVPEGKEPITLRVRDQVSLIIIIICLVLPSHLIWKISDP